MSNIHDEQIKTRASYLNIMAAGTAVTGVVAPGVAAISGSFNWNVTNPLYVAGAATLAVLLSIGLHIAAVLYLKGLTP